MRLSRRWKAKGMQVVEIVKLTEMDISKVANVHYQALAEDFLPSLGLDFLEKVYYPAAINSANAVTFVARSGNDIAGFVTIAPDSPQYTRDVLAGNWISIGSYVFRSLFSRPVILLRSFEVLWSALF